MITDILIEGTIHKNHFKIFDYDCLSLINCCSDLIGSGQITDHSTSMHSSSWIDTIEYYNQILRREILTPRRIKRVENNILINNEAVDGYLFDFLIFYYHILKNNMIIAKEKIDLIFKQKSLSFEEENLLLRLLSHFDLKEEQSISRAV